MAKWILGVVGALLLAGFVYWQANTVKRAYVNGLPLYSQLPGREYILEHDCYVFKFKHHDTQFPLIGANVPGAPMTVKELPRKVVAKYVGADLPDVNILAIAHVGDRFRIASVRRDTSRHGTTITFEILFTNEGARRYSRVNAYWIMNHAPEKQGKAPDILPQYAVPAAL